MLGAGLREGGFRPIRAAGRDARLDRRLHTTARRRGWDEGRSTLIAHGDLKQEVN